ncbi:MAG: zf-HC2 domain-containing protein, partial [Desulfatitalea sp.]
MTGHLVEMLSPYVDGELSPGEVQAVEMHLRDCVLCTRRLAELTTVDEMARGLEVEAPAGYFETFPARLRERLPERTPAPRRLPMWALAGAAVLL